ncbi:unnamed protein product [Musa acuminata subsp. malaccensis]|uniref:(wild Malaysian banana) hypothetical protein n=1 Tax=Musa acuminata subsp. malaccensis TaxID=214687 RepID=A0A804K2B8_MUSAM|nr:unnamed protein product [Musa acuminata subsp. malaccensis]
MVSKYIFLVVELRFNERSLSFSQVYLLYERYKLRSACQAV